MTPFDRDGSSRPVPTSDRPDVVREARRTYGRALLAAMHVLGRVLTHGARGAAIDPAVLDAALDRVEALRCALVGLRRIRSAA